jgi:DNA-binding transcriptional LysR family regulator
MARLSSSTSPPSHRTPRRAAAWIRPRRSRYELTLRRDGERRTVALGPALRSNSERLLRDACVAGAGVLLQTSLHAMQDIAAGRLVVLLEGWRIGSVGIYALYPHRRHLPAKVRACVDFLAGELGGDAGRDPWLERLDAS